MDTAAIIIPAGSQVVIDSKISYELPNCTFLELYSPDSLGRCEPRLCPGILDSAYKESIQLLLVKLNPHPITISRGQVVEHGHLLNAPDALSLHPFGTFIDFNLSKDKPQVLSLFSTKNFPRLSPVQLKEVLDLLD